MTPEPRTLPRRFYKEVSIDARDGGFAVLLDGRALKTPAKQPLVVGARALAEIVAAEWAAQGERIDPATMTATRLVNVALDRAAATRDALAAEVARYAETDVVCHLADEDLELAKREEAAWAPLRAWAGQALGVALEPVAGVRARPQPSASLAAAKARALGYDDLRLTLLAHATALLGSAVLAFAFVEGRLDAAAAFAASRIDEAHQETRWGVDAEAAERTARMAAELAVIEGMLRAVS
jgi:chaperone required for assembly of F1-ATPase